MPNEGSFLLSQFPFASIDGNFIDIIDLSSLVLFLNYKNNENTLPYTLQGRKIILWSCRWSEFLLPHMVISRIILSKRMLDLIRYARY